ncbi:MAG: hypothetical protein JNJ54_05745 [Myxococcaceae bacterium]|nr:hypothetical protein [Myxococcaceae bacterium]
MTTTKLGSTPNTASKLPAVSRTTTPPATAAVAKALGVSHEAATTQPVAFDPAAQSKGVLNPGGQPVATTADPGALWGEGRARGNPELRAAMQEFRKLSPDAQKARIEELKTKQDELSKKMLARIEQLDERYKNMRNVTKAEMLRNLAGKTDAMTPTEKQHLDALLNKADGIAAQIEDLKKQAATLPSSKDATPEQAAERTKLARQIKNARGRLSDATKAATTYVDSLGLKTDRLAVNEQKIDPNAPPPSSPKSLLSMIGEWFKLDKLVNFFTSIFTGNSPIDDHNATPEQRQQARELRTQEQLREIDKRIETRRELDKKVDQAAEFRKQDTAELLPEPTPRTQRQSLDAALRALLKTEAARGS